jgi:hypothetical protein
VKEYGVRFSEHGSELANNLVVMCKGWEDAETVHKTYKSLPWAVSPHIVVRVDEVSEWEEV